MLLLHPFAVTGATGTGVNIMSTAISWSIAYLVIIGSVLTFIAYIYMLQKLPPEIIVLCLHQPNCRGPIRLSDLENH
jgi:hypothetical protein